MCGCGLRSCAECGPAYDACHGRGIKPAIKEVVDKGHDLKAFSRKEEMRVNLKWTLAQMHFEGPDGSIAGAAQFLRAYAEDLKELLNG